MKENVFFLKTFPFLKMEVCFSAKDLVTEELRFPRPSLHISNGRSTVN